MSKLKLIGDFEEYETNIICSASTLLCDFSHYQKRRVQREMSCKDKKTEQMTALSAQHSERRRGNTVARCINIQIE